MDYWDKRSEKWSKNEQLPGRKQEQWVEEEEDYPYRTPKERTPRSRKFSTGFLSKLQKQTIFAVCLLFVVLAAKYNSDGASSAVYGAFKTALSADNDYTMALSEAAKGVLGGGGDKVIAVNNPSEIMLLPVQGNVVKKFGKQSAVDKNFNNGIDISAPLGSDILAPLNGVVLKVGSDQTLGRYVKIEHGNGLASILSNLGEIKVKNGDKLKKGDTLGTLGFTAAIKRPWLHWEVYRGNQPVNPETLLGQPGNKI